MSEPKRNLANEHFRSGSLTAVKYAGQHKDKYHMWYCKCDCGRTVKVFAANLISGASSSCGKACRAKKSKYNLVEHPPFGKLKVVRFAGMLPHGRDGSVCAHWECECECGNVVIKREGQLLYQDAKSCGSCKFDMGIGRRIKKAREMMEMKQEELGAAIGVSLSFISMLESGKKNPLNRLVQIAEALNVPVESLLGRGRKMDSTPEKTQGEGAASNPIDIQVGPNFFVPPQNATAPQVLPQQSGEQDDQAHVV